MQIDQTIVGHFESLLDEALEINQERRVDGNWVDVWYFSRWVVKAHELVRQVAGENSEYFRKIRDASQRSEAAPNPPLCDFLLAAGALRGARDDYIAGRLTDFRSLAAIEVFSDILEAADYLLKQKWHVPAASLAGAVLEDALRRTHRKYIGEWVGDSSISKLNDAMHKGDCYTKPEWRQIQVWGDIRNHADHGEFGEFGADDVHRMIRGIREFSTRHSA